MNDFNRCNKITGVHWLKKPLETLQIIVRIKPLDSILSLPKYEDYTNESSSTNCQQLDKKADEYLFKWQEKVFSRWELQRYKDSHNCISDAELKYHDMIKESDCEKSQIFTYVYEDSGMPLDYNKMYKSTEFSSLSSCLEKLHLDETSSRAHLFRSEDNLTVEQWMAMHIVFDNSNYNEDDQLIMKQEIVLLSLYHNTAQNYLIISPDINDLELNPYAVETRTGVSCGYQYAVGMWFDEEHDDDELVNLLRKLYKKSEKQQKQLLKFVMPPLGKRQYYVTFDIVTAKDFDMDDLYVKFDVKVPKNMQCTDTLHGRTHISKALRVHGAEEWHFGHVIELNLEMEDTLEAAPLELFFEVISTDWWCRHRTEGYSYLALPLDPGNYSKLLSCSRPEELDAVEAQNRRFFVGGCNLIKNLNVLAAPQLQDTNFKFVSSGYISVRWSVISQAHHAGSAATPLPGTSSATALLKGAEVVLRKYKKARARLAAATKDLTDSEIGSGDR